MILNDKNIIFILFFILVPKLCRNIYIEKEAVLCGRLTGAVLRDRIKSCLQSDAILFPNSRLLDDITTVRNDLYGRIRTTIFEDKSQPGVLIVVEKGSGNPTQVVYQFFSGIFQELVNFMGSGKVWRYTYDVHNVHIKWVLNRLENLMRNGTYQRIIFTGHSLGAGTSILDAFACIKAKICRSGNTKVLTFGGPRTGDEVFAEHYNKLLPETYRVVVDGDIVPSFPSCTKNFFSNKCHAPIFDKKNDSWFNNIGYYHVGTEIYYPNGYENKYRHCKPRYEDSDCSPRTLPSVWTLLFYKDELNINHNRYFRIEKNGEYNHEEAQLLGKICAMVSCFWDNECHLNDSLLYNSTKILVKKSTTYHFGPGKFKYMILDYITKPNTIIVVQKGTDNSFQLLEQFFNLYFYDKKIFYNNEKVWDYQFKAHNFYIDDLLDKINDLLMKKKYKNVIFTGHSLGGALSVLDAYECVYRKICNGKTTKVVTLGSPRTGDKSFAVSFNKLIPNTYRVVNRYDPITNFPNCKAYNFMRSCRKHDIISNSDNETFIDEFYHVGTEIWYFEGTTGINSNNYIICERHFDDPNCSRRVKLSDIPLLKQKFLFEKWHVEYFVTKFNKLQLK